MTELTERHFLGSVVGHPEVAFTGDGDFDSMRRRASKHWVEPWISAADIEKGAKWAQAISGELEKSDFGIVCLTPENLTFSWLFFEAGSLAKKEQWRVCTYLYDLNYGDAKDPLSQFQDTLATACVIRHSNALGTGTTRANRQRQNLRNPHPS